MALESCQAPPDYIEHACANCLNLAPFALIPAGSLALAIHILRTLLVSLSPIFLNLCRNMSCSVLVYSWGWHAGLASESVRNSKGDFLC